MRRLVATLAAVLALALGAAPATADSSTVLSSYSITGSAFVCGASTYTVTSGTVSSVVHVGSSASGNTNVSGTLTLRKIVAVDTAGKVESIVGVTLFSGTFNAQTGDSQLTFIGKFQVVSQAGGIADSGNSVFHLSPNGDVNRFDFGTCVL